MKPVKRLAAAGLLLAAQTSFAVEPAEGWYAGFLFGLSGAPDATFDVRSPFGVIFGPTVPMKVSYGLLGDAALQFGFRCGNFRYEAEALFNSNPYRKLRINGLKFERKRDPWIFSMKGYTSIMAGIFNLYYDFFDPDYAETKWAPYAGLGIGYASIQNSVTFYFNGTEITNSKRKLTDSEPIGQAILGINYFFNNCTSLGTDIRYMATGTITGLNERASALNLNLVMNFAFDQPDY